MRTVVVLVVCVGLAYAASIPSVDSELPQFLLDRIRDELPLGARLTKPGYNKEPCCLPSQWQGIISEKVEYKIAGQDDTRISILGQMAVDSTKKQVGLRLRVNQEPRPTNMTVTVDYVKREMYVADMPTRTCTKSKVPTDMVPMCTPPNGTYLGSLRFGAGDKNSMEVDMWQGGMYVDLYTPGQPPLLVDMFLMVTPDLCMPFWEVGGTKSDAFSVGFEVTFFDLETKILDPDIFTPPNFCKQAEVVPHKQALADPHVSNLLKKFSK